MKDDIFEELPIIDFEINYDPETKTVFLYANDFALHQISDCCRMLAIKRRSESHEHFDEVNGLRGNVKELIIIRR